MFYLLKGTITLHPTLAALNLEPEAQLFITTKNLVASLKLGDSNIETPKYYSPYDGGHPKRYT